MDTIRDVKVTAPSPGPPPGLLPGAIDRTLPLIPGYEVLELVGRGGMGRVYRARHLGLGRVVALKLLLHEADENLLARFREEARAVARLQHPNIAQLYESGSADGRPYFAQEFLDGGSLARVLAGKPQPPREAAELVEIVARAVHHSHTQGILHRDLKPGNILLGRKQEGESAAELRLSDFVPKVADFGLAKPLAARGADTKLDSGGALTRTGEILGTPGYMPPEQASGVVANVGPPADVYALGAVLYEMLTGRPPFQTPDPIQTLMLVLTRDPVPPRALQPDVPRDLETICLKCLEKYPKKRYETARDLADDLRRFLDGRPIVARPVGTVERAAKWARRNKAAAGLVAVSAVAAVLLLAAGVALAVSFFKLKGANADLAGKKNELGQTNTQLDQANKNITAEQAETQNALGLTLAALDTYFFNFSERLKNLGADELRFDVLKHARGTLDSLDRFRPDDADIQNYRMAGYDKLGSIESTIGATADAERSFTKSRDLATALAARFPDNPLYRINRAVVTAKIAVLHAARGDNPSADALIDSVVPVMNEFATTRPDDVKVVELRGMVRLHLLQREMRADRWDDAEARMRELCDIDRRLVKLDPTNPVRAQNVIDGDRRLALMLIALDKVNEAEPILLRAKADADALPDRAAIPVRKLRAAVHASLGSYYENKKRFPQAVAAYREALTEYESLSAPPSKSVLFRYLRTDTLRYLGHATALGGDRAAGVKHLEEAERLANELVANYPKDTGLSDLRDLIKSLLVQHRTPPKPPDKKP